MSANLKTEPTAETSPRRKGRIRRVLKRVFYLILILIGAVAVYAWATVARQDPIETGDPHMKAVVYTNYGSPDVLEIRDVKKPLPNDDQVLVKVRAASLNPLDWHYMEGTPYMIRAMGAGLRKPKSPRLGVDLAVEQAAAVPIAALTALQGLRNTGKVHPGQKVLINGASGGVGTFAVQIAKSFGADVTGVCSTKNLDLVRSLGADHVIDYTKQDFTNGAQRYDLILDNVGTQPLSGFRRALKPQGICVMIGGGGPNEGRWIGAMARPVKALLLSPFVSQKMSMMLAEIRQEDLTIMRDLMEAGKVTPVVDKTYPLSQVRQAMKYLEAGHARGKVILTMWQDDKT